MRAAGAASDASLARTRLAPRGHARSTRRASSFRCRSSLNFLWLILGVLTVLEAINDLFGTAGPDWL